MPDLARDVLGFRGAPFKRRGTITKHIRRTSWSVVSLVDLGIAIQPASSECNLPELRPQVRYNEVAQDDAGMRLDNYLLRELHGVPRSYVYRIIRSGEVRINKGRAKPASRVQIGDSIRIPPVRLPAKNDPGRPPDDLIKKVLASVLLETDDFWVFNKPAGLAVHAGSGLRFGLIEILRAARPDQKWELVHRLDRSTSGCLLVARNRQALNGLSQAMRHRDAEKCYVSLLAGHWQSGECCVDAALVRDRERGGERMVEVDTHAEHAKSALSYFSPQETFTQEALQASLMQVRIVTGRTHQIRVHAAHLGHPVAGDDKYGLREFNKQMKGYGLTRCFLHAWRLTLPGIGNGEALHIEAPLPDELEHVLKKLRQSK